MAKDKDIHIRIDSKMLGRFKDAAKAMGMSLTAWILKQCDKR